MKKLGLLTVAMLMLSFAFASLVLARAGPEKRRNVVVATQVVVVCESIVLSVHQTPVMPGDNSYSNQGLTANVRGDEQYKHESNFDSGQRRDGIYYQQAVPGIVLRL